MMRSYSPYQLVRRPGELVFECFEGVPEYDLRGSVVGGCIKSTDAISTDISNNLRHDQLRTHLNASLVTRSGSIL